ncbi:hypothetical protein HMPREF1077_03323 [Parabacteroides johnsonii CL02T12C29]|uniref:Uncharacterized protein n=1 Tax=Parabacteroides johnsonii CL02T12C29 TaxID=999419 RepID=K5Y0F9_9BACT|nr:hypothetical protein HMPREF1077_03323 [Parabacteroides johnsonii CL02T12C29]
MSESVGAGFYSAQWKITSPYRIPMGRAEPCPYKYTMLINQTLYVPEIVLPPSPVQLV